MAQRARRERERSGNYTPPLPRYFPGLTPTRMLKKYNLDRQHQSLSQVPNHVPFADMELANDNTVPLHFQPSPITILAEHLPNQLCNVEVKLLFSSFVSGLNYNN